MIVSALHVDAEPVRDVTTRKLPRDLAFWSRRRSSAYSRSRYPPHFQLPDTGRGARPDVENRVPAESGPADDVRLGRHKRQLGLVEGTTGEHPSQLKSIQCYPIIRL